MLPSRTAGFPGRASYLGLSQVPQSEVQSAQVVEDLGRDVGLHLLLQDAGGGAVGRQGPLDVRLLQDLRQLDPRLHVVRVLLRHLLQVSLLVEERTNTLRQVTIVLSIPLHINKGTLLHT